MKSYHIILGCITAVVTLLTCSTDSAAQTEVRKQGHASGLSPVSNATVEGFVIAGQPAAERVSGESLSGWIGFMPYKIERPTSVEEDRMQATDVAPNPTQSTVRISDVTGKESITLLSQDARIVKVPMIFVEGAVVLGVQSLPNGSYTAIIRSETRTRYARFVVAR